MICWIGRSPRARGRDQRHCDKAGARREPAPHRSFTALTSLLLAVVAAGGAEPAAPCDYLDFGAKVYVRDLAFSPDGAKLAVLNSEDDSVTLWDATTKKQIAALRPKAWRPCAPLTFTPDGKRLVVGGTTLEQDNGRDLTRVSVNIWEAAANKERQAVVLPKDAKGGWVVTPDGKSLLAGTAVGGVLVFDLETGKQTKAFQCDATPSIDEVTALALSADGKTLAVGTMAGALFVCDLEKGVVRHKNRWAGQLGQIKSEGSNHDIALLLFSPDGKRLVSAGLLARRVQVWDPATGQNIDSLLVSRTMRHPRALAFSPDGKTLAMGGDNALELWWFVSETERGDLTDLAPQVFGRAPFNPGAGNPTERGAIEHLTFSPDGKRLATAGLYAPLALWDVPPGVAEPTAPCDSLDHAVGGRLWNLALSPDGRLLALYDDDRTVSLLDIATKKRVAPLESKGWWASPDFCFTADGKDLIVGGSSVIVWDLATLKERRRIDDFEKTSDSYGHALFTPDGKSMIIASTSRGVLVFDMASGKLTKSIQCDEPPIGQDVRVMALSPDGNTLAVGTGSGSALKPVAGGGALFICDLEKGEVRHKIPEAGQDYPGDAIHDMSQLAFSPDGKRLVSCRQLADVVQVWDPATGKNLDFLQAGHAMQHIAVLAFSPDGKTLAMGGEFAVELWDVGLRGFRDDFSGRSQHCAVAHLAFSPDGKTLVTGGVGGAIDIWDVPAGAPKGVRQDKNPPPGRPFGSALLPGTGRP